MRINVSIPDDLHARMRRVRGVVWSNVAADAFEAKLAEIAKNKEIQNMKDVIERLKGAKHDDRREVFGAGREAGKSWAEEEATPTQLRRLDEVRDECGTGQLSAPLWWPGWIFQIADPSLDANEANEHAELFIEDVDLRDEEDAIAWADGFVAGAMSIWDAVKDAV